MTSTVPESPLKIATAEDGSYSNENSGIFISLKLETMKAVSDRNFVNLADYQAKLPLSVTRT